jgi:hypothetical protein
LEPHVSDDPTDLILSALKAIHAKQDEHTVALQEIREMINSLKAECFLSSRRMEPIASEPETSNWHLTSTDAPDV